MEAHLGAVAGGRGAVQNASTHEEVAMKTRNRAVIALCLLAVAGSAGAVDVTCYRSGGAQSRLTGVTSPDMQDPRTLEVRVGSALRAVSLGDIESLTFTRPANRISRYAFASLKTRGQPQPQDVAISLMGLDRTVELEGTGADGAHGRLDILSCERLAFDAR